MPLDLEEALLTKIRYETSVKGKGARANAPSIYSCCRRTLSANKEILTSLPVASFIVPKSHPRPSLLYVHCKPASFRLEFDHSAMEDMCQRPPLVCKSIPLPATATLAASLDLSSLAGLYRTTPIVLLLPLKPTRRCDLGLGLAPSSTLELLPLLL